MITDYFTTETIRKKAFSDRKTGSFAFCQTEISIPVTYKNITPARTSHACKDYPILTASTAISSFPGS